MTRVCLLRKIVALRISLEERRALYLNAIRQSRKYYQQICGIIAGIRHIQEIRGFPMGLDEEKILLAAGMAIYHHRGQRRKSGEPYIVHPMGLAKILFRRLHCPDGDVYVAALLHDLVEETDVTLDDIKLLFGESVAFLVNGLTKVSEAAEERNVEKFVFYLRRDIRILLLKAVDRGHNLQTARWLTDESRERNAREALDLYVPLCRLAGFMKAARQLSDIAFKILNPDRHQELSELIDGTQREYAPIVKSVQEGVKREFNRRERTKISLRKRLKGVVLGPEEEKFLREKRISFLDKPKTPYELEQVFPRALAEKFPLRGMTVYPFSDVVMLQVTVDDEEDCFEVYRMIHSLGEIDGKKVRPHDRFHRDFINDPKLNLYKSLHTAVEVGGVIIRFQIRTKRMQETAEMGVIAESYHAGKFVNPKLPWLNFDYIRELMKPEKSLADKEELLRKLQASRYATVRIRNPEICSVSEAPLPLDISPIEVAFVVDPKIAMRVDGAVINSSPHDVLEPYQERISMIDLYAGEKVVYRDYLSVVKDEAARRRLVRYLRGLPHPKRLEYAEAALGYWLERYYLTMQDIRDFDEILKQGGYGGIIKAMRVIGKGIKSAYDMLLEIIRADAESSLEERIVTVRFHLKDWPEEDFFAITTPLRRVFGHLKSVSVGRQTKGSGLILKTAVPVHTELGLRQLKNFVGVVGREYARHVIKTVIDEE